MALTGEGVFVRFGGDTEDFERAIAAARAQIREAAQAMRDNFATASAQFQQHGGTIASVLGTVGQRTKSHVDEMDTFVSRNMKKWAAWGAVVGVAYLAYSGKLSEARQATEDFARKAEAGARQAADAIGAGVDTAKQKFGEWQEAALSAGRYVRDNWREVASDVAAGLASMVANAAGDALLKTNQKVVNLAGDLDKLSQVTGISVETLSRWKVTAESLGVGVDAWRDAMKRFVVALDEGDKEGEELRETLKAMGVAFDDLKGAEGAAELVARIAAKFADYEAGAKKAALANAVFGDGLGAALIPEMNKGEDAIRSYTGAADRLGVVLSQIQATNASRILSIQRGDAVEAEKSLERLRTLYIGLEAELKAFGRTNRGVWADVKAVVTEGASATGDVIDDRVRATLRSIGIGGGAGLGNAGAGGRGPGGGVTPPGVPDKPKGEKESAFGAWQQELRERQIAERKFFGDSKAEELAYWREKLKVAAAGSKDRASVIGRIYELEKTLANEAVKSELAELDARQEMAGRELETVEALERAKLEVLRRTHGEESAEYKAQHRRVLAAERELVEQQKRLRAEAIDQSVKMQEIRIELDRENYRQMFELGDVSAREQIRRDAALEEELYQVKRNALEQKRQLLGEELEANENLAREIEELEERRQLRRRQLDTQERVAVRNQWRDILSPIQSTISTSIQGMILGTTTLRQAIRNLGVNVLASFVDLGVKMLVNWIATQMGMTAATAAGATSRTGVEAAATATKIGLKSAEAGAAVAAAGVEMGADTAAAAVSVATGTGAATTNIIARAWEAAAGAYAAISAIPYIGPFLAPAIAAGTVAAVIGMIANVASAAGGWDRVPEDQLAMIHKDEMVLPAPLADRVRNMTGGGGGGGHPLQVIINAIDRRGIERFFRENEREVGRAGKRLQRNFFGRGK